MSFDPHTVGIVYLFLLPVLLFALYVAFLFVVTHFDSKRITDDLAGRRCRLLSMNAAGLWEGGLGDNAHRIYKIRYLDAEGRRHVAICKTSMFDEVYFRNDRAEGTPAPRQPTALELENARLRAELDQLQRRHH